MKNIPLYDVRPIRDIKDMFTSSTTIFADRTAFLIKKEEGGSYIPVTYRAFQADVNAFGTALISMGYAGKRIAIIGENRYEWAVAYMAIVCGVGIVVPLDKEVPASELQSLLERSKTELLVFSNSKRKDLVKIIPNLQNEVQLVCMDARNDSVNTEANTAEDFAKPPFSFTAMLADGQDLLKKGDTRFLNAEIDTEAMSILLYTSGTTAQSKAVMLNHRNIASDLMDMCAMLYIDKNDVFLSVLPLHHTYESTCGFLCQIYRGCCIAYCEGLRHILKNLKESKTTIMNAVPLILEAIYRRIWDQAAKDPKTYKKLKMGLGISNAVRTVGIDVRRKLFAPIHETFGGHLRLFISGGAPIDPNVIKGFQDFGIQCVQGYGLTECSPIIALNRNCDFKNDAAGLPIPHAKIRIDSPNEEGIGEIVATGPNVMMGYYENEEATQAVLRDGWFYTGDLGYIDSDGFIHITGRKKNVIVTKNGKNIYPEEIEFLLSQNRLVKESMVYGRTLDGSGELEVAAEIFPDAEKVAEALGTDKPSETDVYSLINDVVHEVNKKLTLYKYIRYFTIRDEEFSKTTSKKIKRHSK